ncbi:hypothetical protein HMPREF9148_02019 [Prevotella sp. F0091]|nr:hypothetical protein HMPREF9148_02019 [Prevotella sp. F0091]
MQIILFHNLLIRFLQLYYYNDNILCLYLQSMCLRPTQVVLKLSTSGAEAKHHVCYN